MKEWKWDGKYPVRCRIEDADGKEVMPGVVAATPSVSKPHIGKEGIAELIMPSCRVKITLDDGGILWGEECWWHDIPPRQEGDQTVSGTINPRDKSVNERWPTIKKVFDPKTTIHYLAEWGEDHPGFSPDDVRNEIHRHFIERMEAEQVPVSELIDAVAENLSSITMKQIIKLAMKQKR